VERLSALTLDAYRRPPHIEAMTKEKKSIVDADPKAIDRWDGEGGASARGDQSTGGNVKDQESYLKSIRPYSDAIAKIFRKVRSELRARWKAGAANGEDGSE
jgi:hypothetical protein